jgi:hypothetical protein
MTAVRLHDRMTIDSNGKTRAQTDDDWRFLDPWFRSFLLHSTIDDSKGLERIPATSLRIDQHRDFIVIQHVGNSFRSVNQTAANIFDIHFTSKYCLSQGYQTPNGKWLSNLRHDHFKTAAMQTGRYTGRQVAPTSYQNERAIEFQ